MQRIVALVFLVFMTGRASADLIVGVDANYSLEMESKGSKWKWNDQAQELFAGMLAQGATSLRVRLWTNDDGPSGKNYVTALIERAKKGGLDPWLVIFLSDDWADLTKQPAPKIWKDQPLDQRIATVRKYAEDIVRHMRQHGLTNHLYEIGNEIDFGICGVYPAKHAKKDPGELAGTTWPDAARIIKACEEGVKAADPDAKFMLHIAHWWDADFCVAFFKFMQSHEMQVDFAGITYYPSSGIGGSLTFDQFRAVIDRVHDETKLPIIIPETGYPSTADFSGQFAAWKREAPGYPLTPEGQEKWTRGLLGWCRQDAAVAGVYYWSPEWYGEGMWKAFALFDPSGEAKPAWKAFSRTQGR